MQRFATRRKRKKFEATYLRRPVGALAKLKRRYLTHPTFVGITGTAGKTTTKELTAAVLDCLGPGVKSPGERNRRSGLELHSNSFRNLVHSIFSTTQRHRYCVQELGAEGPGSLDELLHCFQPNVSVILNVGLEHHRAFRTFEAVAEEKGKLVEALPANGTAVLNADDQRVLAMRERTSANVVTFGLSADADVRAQAVCSAWPEPLRFDVVCDGRTQNVQTQLHGEHWVSAVLAAIAVGRVLGVPLPDAAAAVARVPAVAGRLDEVTTPEGVTFLCDDLKFPYWNADTFLTFVDGAEASRKLIVFGTMSDYPGAASQKYRKVAHKALQVADVVVYVGTQFASSLRKIDAPPGRLITCTDVSEAGKYLRRNTGHGDLVFLKGSYKTDHLRRLVTECWRGEGCTQEPAENTNLAGGSPMAGGR